ncbi:glutathione S-transferase 1, isoform C [Nephila pilipes]|uniref:Glutathione S-transferase 1, isoform C n=1 Tax=Nephila pilipes TaxID=299642 RepID=A0A8X6UG44_NEPPI|nr:glutathione S-transferase 1, isoform C [Nephila pilipes]
MEISPPCRAVLMTIRHLGIQAELREENLIIGNSNRHPEFLKINPRSCVPTIDDDGFYLWESRAIMTYLVNKYSASNSIYPKDPKKRAVVDMMLNFDQGTLYRSQVEYLYPMIFRGEPSDPLKESSYKNSLISLEHSLERNAYVAGKHLTLADFSIVANISLAEAYNYNLKHFPNILSWLRRLKMELPYYREINEIPLLQFKFWYRPYKELDDDEEIDSETDTNSTKM